MPHEPQDIKTELDAVSIIYDGLDAEQGAMDMVSLARSLDGYARILATASTFAVSFVYQKHFDAMPVRVTVETPEHGSFKLAAIVKWVGESKLFDEPKELFKRVLEWLMARLSGKTKEQTESMERIVMALIEQSGRDKNEMFALMNKMVDGLQNAAKNAVAPVGETCSTARVTVNGP